MHNTLTEDGARKVASRIREHSVVKQRLKSESLEVRLAAAKILLRWVEGMMALFDRNPEISLKELHAHVGIVKAEIAAQEQSANTR
jgi:hypothetical protein